MNLDSVGKLMEFERKMSNTRFRLEIYNKNLSLHILKRFNPSDLRAIYKSFKINQDNSLMSRTLCVYLYIFL